MSEPRHEQRMARALLEAERGRGRTHPNPIVGAVLVKGGKIVSVGHHERAGGPHAEVAALAAAGARAKGADLYVTLEPCNHHGRTPPCTEAIVSAGVKRVFFGSPDPNPLVDGRGAARLRRAKVEVHGEVLRAACDAANEAWFKFILTGLPWVVLKAAVTLDGKLATASGDARWISSDESRALVHQWRDQLDAVLVGIGTALADDPLLTVRGVPGGRNPVRVVVDSRGRLPRRAQLLKAPGRTLLATVADVALPGAETVRCKPDRRGQVDLLDLLRKLAKRGLTSVLVEGGASLHGAFLRAGLWDELRLFIAPKLAGKDGLSWAGFAGPRAMGRALQLQFTEAGSVGDDLLVLARPHRSGSAAPASSSGRRRAQS